MQTDARNAKLFAWLYRYLPYIGLFLLTSQVVRPVLNFARFTTGSRVQAEFVQKGRFATAGSTSRGIGESNCDYSYKLASGQTASVLNSCKLLPTFDPVPGQKYPVVVVSESPLKILPAVSYAPGWMAAFTALMGLAMLLGTRRIIPKPE